VRPDAVAAWFLDQRGIERETLKAFGVKLDLERGNVLFPYPNGMKERPDPTVPLREGQRRFYFTKGVRPDLFVCPADDYVDQDGNFDGPCFLVEGETDCMKLWQEMGGNVAVFGIGGTGTWRTELAKWPNQFPKVFVILDNDQTGDDYARGAPAEQAVEKLWRSIRHDIPKAKRIRLPHHVKDVCEFFEHYDVDTLRQLSAKTGLSRYKPLDLSLPPPPVEWVLEDWVARGDVTFLAGKGALGKSWLTMALAKALLAGDQECLDLTVHNHGRVLYFDEENPIDVVYSRLLRLGLDPVNVGGNLRYIWSQGVKLDREVERLIDEAEDYKPSLIVFDSFTRLHSKDENSNSEMAHLINESLKPLARETNAAVICIHHHDKQGNGARGAADIFNAADAVIDVFHGGPAMPDSSFVLHASKTRRRGKSGDIHVAIEDQSNGSVKLVVDPPLDLSKLDF
jgi:hypothetical protein